MKQKKPRRPLSCTKETTLTNEKFIELYRYLKLTRMFDEKTVRLKKQSKLTGGVFTSLGQEATAVGTAFALEEKDFIAPLIRDIGACFVKGIEPRTIFLQYFGRGTAPSRATDVQFHFADLEKGFVGPISHLGDMIPVMTGILLAARMRNEDRVAVAYLGEGASSTGTFHEGVNFAAVKKLPLITIIENNGYAYSTPTREQAACTQFVEKALGYGIKGLQVDGNDIVACYETMKSAVDYARTGNGSVLIEAMTYRRKGHAEHDNQAYVPEGEIEWWAEHNDPVTRFEKYLSEQEILSNQQMDDMAVEIKEFLNAEAEWAEDQPPPEPVQAAMNVFDNSFVSPAYKKQVLDK
ncbi:MAG: thiamine pyrophosphate-dependent dehydrogenase E1 component subunit alpha [Acidobacteriota bacterium]|nr:thiamine pyrophosphate-dependent dehydrogenase E1 component subunit alpha [Acidobacteriota bacterium]MDH3528337.1 thiamine pyrophosphate-dependent dehydrogenase E1 component subunit alpha [Acidobacteriota bacterium]